MATQAQMFSFTPAMVKPADEAQAEISRLRMELHKAQRREAKATEQWRLTEQGAAITNQQNRDLLERLNAQTGKIKTLVEVINQLQAQQTDPGKSSIPVEMWRRLVQLCHPDRHSNSDAATTATQWLNKVRP